MECVRSFCNFRYHKYIKGDSVRIPKTLTPNDVLVNLFKPNDPRLVQYLASILERFAGDKILALISNDYVKEVISSIPEITNVNQVALALNGVFPK